MNIKTLIDYFEVFANNHPILRTFSWGNLSDYSRDTFITQYPAIHIVPLPGSIDKTFTDMSFSVLVYDLLNEDVDTPLQSNQLDSMALTQEILNDFINEFINELTDFGFFLQMPVQYTPFVDRFAESVCGIEANITITAEQTSCIPDFDWCNQLTLSTNYTPSGFANPNGTYTLLNEGSGIYVDTSVRIRCEDYLGDNYSIWGLDGGVDWLILVKPNTDTNNFVLTPQYQSYPSFECGLDEPSFFTPGARFPIRTTPSTNGLLYPEPGKVNWGSSFNATISYPSTCLI